MRLNVGVPTMPTFHVPPCDTAGIPRMPMFQTPACITLGVLLTFTLGMPLIVTLPATGNGDGARTGTGLASVLTTVVGADGGVCGSATASAGIDSSSDATQRCTNVTREVFIFIPLCSLNMAMAT